MIRGGLLLGDLRNSEVVDHDNGDKLVEDLSDLELAVSHRVIGRFERVSGREHANSVRSAGDVEHAARHGDGLQQCPVAERGLLVACEVAVLEGHTCSEKVPAIQVIHISRISNKQLRLVLLGRDERLGVDQGVQRQGGADHRDVVVGLARMQVLPILDHQVVAVVQEVVLLLHDLLDGHVVGVLDDVGVKQLQVGTVHLPLRRDASVLRDDGLALHMGDADLSVVGVEGVRGWQVGQHRVLPDLALRDEILDQSLTSDALVVDADGDGADHRLAQLDGAALGQDGCHSPGLLGGGDLPAATSPDVLVGCLGVVLGKHDLLCHNAFLSSSSIQAATAGSASWMTMDLLSGATSRRCPTTAVPVMEMRPSALAYTGTLVPSAFTANEDA